MGKKGGGEIEISEYLMSQHVGICLSADELKGIYIGEKPAWTGSQVEGVNINISKPSLFGGQKKEGGVQGVVTYLPGLSDQVLPDALAQKLGRVSGADCPGFRGITSLFFHSSTNKPHGLIEVWSSIVSGATWGGFPIGAFGTGFNRVSSGFHWVSNNPYMKDLWVKVKRAPKGLNPATATIPRIGGIGLTQFTFGAPVVLKWWQRTYAQAGGTNDQARMGVQYYGANGEALGNIIWSPLIATDPTMWTERTLNSTIPPECYGLRVYMEMNRVYGSYNDGYIDDITLTVGANVVGLNNAGGEVSGNAGWTNEVGDVGRRFTNPTPRTGTAYFTGGAYPVSRAYQMFTEAATGDDANPAHMIYECLTNGEWGMGAAPSLIDVGSFEQAGVLLLLEGLGLSMIWTRQTTVEAFVSEVLDHIQATLFVNPRNGLLTLKLIRGDYNVDDLRHITVDNAQMSNFQRKAWGEIINEIVVTWTNPENEQDETVTIQDNSAIASQGGIVSDSRNYYGVRSSELAMKLAARDLRTSSTPLAACDVTLNRTAWDLLPGEVVKVTWEERGLNAVPMRVGPVDYGRPGEPEIKASLVEDIFGYATTDYSPPPSTDWEDDDIAPADMQHAKIITVPSFFAANYLPATGGLADIDYPEVIAGVLATSLNALAYDLYGDKVQVDGTITQEVFATNTVAGYATLTGPLAEEATSTFVGFTNFMGRVTPAQNIFMFIGGTTVGDAATEVALITENTTGSFTVRRGILDTVPRVWDAGTPCYFIEFDSAISDKIIRSDAETFTYKLLSRTVGGILPVDDADPVTGTLNGRPHLPLRPANVKVNGEGFGTIDINAVDPIPVTWSNRNRTMENSQVVFWDDATVMPEVGQTTTVSLHKLDGTLISETTGLTGTSHSIPASAFSGNSSALVRVKAVRDGLDSLQSHQLRVFIDNGYGLQYGYNYGGDVPTTGGGTGTGGGTSSFPTSASWSVFSTVSTTAYTPLTNVKTVSLAAGGTLTAAADLVYTASGTARRYMNAKWQFAIAGTGIWMDFGSPVTGDLTNVDVDPTAAISVPQSIGSIPAQDYDVRLVANISSGGATLSSTGTASVTVT